MQVRKIRILRNKYGISASEVAHTCGMSWQRISDIELKTEADIQAATANRIIRAFAEIIEKRHDEYQKMYQDFQCHRDSLMECVEEIGYEL